MGLVFFYCVSSFSVQGLILSKNRSSFQKLNPFNLKVVIFLQSGSLYICRLFNKVNTIILHLFQAVVNNINHNFVNNYYFLVQYSAIRTKKAATPFCCPEWLFKIIYISFNPKGFYRRTNHLRHRNTSSSAFQPSYSCAVRLQAQLLSCRLT